MPRITPALLQGIINANLPSRLGTAKSLITGREFQLGGGDLCDPRSYAFDGDSDVVVGRKSIEEYDQNGTGHFIQANLRAGGYLKVIPQLFDPAQHPDKSLIEYYDGEKCNQMDLQKTDQIPATFPLSMRETRPLGFPPEPHIMNPRHYEPAFKAFLYGIPWK